MSTLTSIIRQRRLLMSPIDNCPWANEMVLNPGVIRDPRSGRLHMLFRATGNGRRAGEAVASDWAYPIYLGYACSDDNGRSWRIDVTRPAMKPELAVSPEDLQKKDAWGRHTINFANGCIEDPRLFWFEGGCHLIVACRVFPPGAYWLLDDPMQLAPRWARETNHGFGRAVSENVTVNLIYKVDLEALTRGSYEGAFKYLTHLTNPEFGENRDVLLFPRRLIIGGEPKVVCLHRPWEAHHYVDAGQGMMRPSIWFSEADSIEKLSAAECTQRLLAQPRFEWESNRIGASAPPIELEAGRWLISYHGKQDSEIGYTQSFLILEEGDDDILRIKHRCSERLLVPSENWEMPGKFSTPCLFVTAIVPHHHDDWMVFYGASDERIGVAFVDRQDLLHHIERYDDMGEVI